MQNDPFQSILDSHCWHNDVLGVELQRLVNQRKMNLPTTKNVLVSDSQM